MTLNTLNLFVFLFVFLFILFFFIFSSSLNLLILSELFWITLYLIVITLAYVNNDINLLSFSLFFLIFSASEISLAFIILNIHSFIFNSLNINFLNFKNVSFLNKFIKNII